MYTMLNSNEIKVYNSNIGDLKLSFFQSITSSVSNSVGGNVEHIGGNYRLLN